MFLNTAGLLDPLQSFFLNVQTNYNLGGNATLQIKVGSSRIQTQSFREVSQKSWVKGENWGREVRLG